jgi:predicted dehydrogenase
MFEECELDGVVIVGDAKNLHCALGMEALKRGIHLMVEKPPANNPAAYAEMLAVAKEKDLVLMTALMKLHGMAYAKARQMIVSGQFRPTSAYLHYGTWAPKANPEKPFQMGRDQLHGLMFGMGIHIVGLAWHFFGKPVSVTTALSTTRESYSLPIVMRFPEGNSAVVLMDGAPRIQERVEICGYHENKAAFIVVDNVQHMELHQHGRLGVDHVGNKANGKWGMFELHEIKPDFDLADIQMWRPDYSIPNQGQSRPFFQGYVGEVREFVDAIIEKRQPYPSPEDVNTIFRLCETIAENPNGTVSFT